MATLTSLASSQPPTSRTPSDKTLSKSIPHFISVLQKSLSIKELTQIHTQLLKSNLIQDPLIFTKILSSYSSLNLQSALQLFSSLPQRNSMHWFTLIHGCSLSPTPANSIFLYMNLIEEDPFCLNSLIFPSVIKACGKVSAGFEGTQIHSHAVKCGFVRDIYVQNSLIQMYFGCGRSKDARKLFDQMSERNVVTWNCVIGGYAELALWENVIYMFKEMVGVFSVIPNSVTLVRVVTGCCRLGDIEMGKWVHGYVVDNGVPLCLNLGNVLMNMYAKFGDMEEARRLFHEMVERDVVSWTTLISGYASVGDIGVARVVFDEMPVRNLVAWNAMIAGYVHNGCFQEAIFLFEEMQALDVKTDKATLVSLLSACARSGDLFTGKVIHGYISKMGINMTVDLLHSILGLYSKCGDIDSAELLFNKMGFKNEISFTLMMEGYVTCGAKEIALDLFKQMPHKDVASWNALITALARHNHFNDALDIFEEMQKMKVKPNSLTLVSTLSACSRVGALELGKWIHAYIDRNNIKIDAQLSCSLIDMYAKCGDVELSHNVFNKMPHKDLVSWSTMIRGLAMHGHSKVALEYFQQMEEFGAKPDAVTFLGVLSACSHAGLIEEGKYYFNLMSKTYGISPTAGRTL
ncbi:uncharacterized protein A4U43_C07F32550 [Asparagus officinalis]|uniref:Pentacotripeptide-repeat region of PRORP domain-containing protein n=1 Tax=Asparagus officinalis TaxID=4686 RepID=A0A5P1EK89_ASPOF|nr:uncharacterized protein A4U43_C07F32550 [Asparagus officinalis]